MEKMEEAEIEKQEKKKVSEAKIFCNPDHLDEINKNMTITTNTPSTQFKKQIINQAIQFHLKGNISEAIKGYQYCINQGFNDHQVFSNYAGILLGIGKSQEAELSYRKAIQLNPNFAEAHSNLGTLFKNLGKLKEAELSCRKAIQLNPNFAMAHSNLGCVLKDLGKLQEAELAQRKAIQLNPNFAMAHANLGSVLHDLGKLKQAELSFRKAIELNPKSAIAHSNLGSILMNLGELKDAELSLCKAIQLDPKFSKSYLSLSRLKYSTFANNLLKDKLFSEKILKNRSQSDQINIYFARANILHKEKNYQESSRYLDLANQLELKLKPSKKDLLINKSKALLIESNKKEINKKEPRNSSQNIFIVGMPRCGSTLLESILSMSNDVYTLGEINILEESFLDCKRLKPDIKIAEIYAKKINNKTDLKITINKWLYNYQYAGIIAKNIPKAKIIHCYRHPLDNILSIYRTHFARGNDYSSSLADCTRVYLNQEEIMTEYKNRFRSKIYDLNYDLLVSDPNKQIKTLISWLGWEWDDKYLSPHLNPRSVSTASRVQVRSPINSKSIGGWKNYKDMLEPAIEILTQTDRYKNLIS